MSTVKFYGDLSNTVTTRSGVQVEAWIKYVYRLLGRPKRGRCPRCGRFVRFGIVMHCPRCEVMVYHFYPLQLTLFNDLPPVKG